MPGGGGRARGVGRYALGASGSYFVPPEGLLLYEVCIIPGWGLWGESLAVGDPPSFVYMGWVPLAMASPALLSSPSGLQAGGSARGTHPGGGQQAGPSAAALRTSSCTGHASSQRLALWLPRVLSQIQLARTASLPRASALCFGAHTSCTSSPAPAGGTAPSALQPHVIRLDREIS